MNKKRTYRITNIETVDPRELDAWNAMQKPSPRALETPFAKEVQNLFEEAEVFTRMPKRKQYVTVEIETALPQTVLRQVIREGVSMYYAHLTNTDPIHAPAYHAAGRQHLRIPRSERLKHICPKAKTKLTDHFRAKQDACDQIIKNLA